MALPTLEELRVILKSYNKTETDFERLIKLPYKDIDAIHKAAGVNKKSLEKLTFFIDKYSNKRLYVRSKCSQKNLKILGEDLYRATSIMFKDKEICEFRKQSGLLLDYSIAKYGRVLILWSSITEFWRRMDRLEDFFELHSGRSHGFWDKRDSHIIQLKTDMVYAYLFMLRRAKTGSSMGIKFSLTPGQKFGKWTVLGEEGKNKNGSMTYRCRCDCGTERTIVRHCLTTGQTKQCKRCAIRSRGSLMRNVCSKKEYY